MANPLFCQYPTILWPLVSVGRLMIIMMYMWCIGRFERFERKQKIIAESNKMKMKVLFRPIVVLCEVYSTTTNFSLGMTQSEPLPNKIPKQEQYYFRPATFNSPSHSLLLP